MPQVDTYIKWVVSGIYDGVWGGDVCVDDKKKCEIGFNLHIRYSFKEP